MYRIDKNSDGTGIAGVTEGNSQNVKINYSNGSLTMEAPEAISSVAVYDMSGALLLNDTFKSAAGSAAVAFDAKAGVYVARIVLESGCPVAKKILVK